MQRSSLLVTACALITAGPAAAVSDPALANPTDPTVAPEIVSLADPVQDQYAGDLPAFGPIVALLASANESQDEGGDVGAPVRPPAITQGASDSLDTALDEQPVAPQTEAVAGEPEQSASESIPLGRPIENELLVRASETGAASMSDGWFVRTAVALAAVIGLILATRFVLQWIELRTTGGSVMTSNGKVRAPSGLVEVLARYPVSRGTKLLMLKVNSRILLVSQTSSGLSTLSEIDDPDEVASILIKSRDEEGDSAAARFMEVLREMENDPRIAPERVDVRSPRRALSDRLAESEDREQSTPLDGASALRNRLSHLGDLSA